MPNKYMMHGDVHCPINSDYCRRSSCPLWMRAKYEENPSVVNKKTGEGTRHLRFYEQHGCSLSMLVLGRIMKDRGLVEFLDNFHTMNIGGADFRKQWFYDDVEDEEDEE